MINSARELLYKSVVSQLQNQNCLGVGDRLLIWHEVDAFLEKHPKIVDLGFAAYQYYTLVVVMLVEKFGFRDNREQREAVSLVKSKLGDGVSCRHPISTCKLIKTRSSRRN